MRIRITFIAICVLAWAWCGECSPRGIIYTLLRDNVAGAPLVHQKQTWSFDPNVALRRRVEFERLHGYKSALLVERSGLGEDGRMEERRLQQLARDAVPVPPEQDWHPGQSRRKRRIFFF